MTNQSQNMSPLTSTN